MIPSLLQIPSAVSDSKLHSVLPNNGKGDFQFERSTGATRINKDGLIEEVGYFSSELVQNGNFSELGSELVTNGDFATNSDWNLGTGWSINNGKAVGENAGSPSVSYLSQDFAFVSGKTYKVVYTVSEYVKGNVRPQLASPGSQNLPNVSANGTYTEYIVANNNFSKFRFRAATTDGGFTGKIDNVSVKQVDPNDRWEAEGNSTLNFADFQGKSQVAKINITDTATNSRIRQAFNYVSGTKYKISVEVYLVSGSFRVDSSDSFVGGDFVSTTTTGSWITLEANIDAVATGSNYVWLRSISDVSEFYVSNISIVEVQGDRPRLSYDITNGVVEDKPHLLLEPSSSNKLTTSNDFSSYSKSGTITLTSNYGISPTGERNSTRVQFGGSNNSLYKLSVHSGNTESNSIHIKGVSGETIKFGKGTTVNAGSTFTLNGEWQRIQHQSTTGNQFAINTYSSVTARDIEIFGAQIEEQSYATSYIPTAGTTITRAAETCNNSKPSVNSTEGVLYAEIAAFISTDSVYPNRYITISNGTQNERVCILFGGNNNQIRYIAFSSSQSLNVSISDTTNDVKNFNKVAVVYKSGEYKMFINGSQSGSTNTASAIFSSGTLNTVNFDLGSGILDFYGKVKGLAVYNEALSESQLMQLTGVTASSIYNNFVTRTASFTVEALNEVKKVIDNL